MITSSLLHLSLRRLRFSLTPKLTLLTFRFWAHIHAVLTRVYTRAHLHPSLCCVNSSSYQSLHTPLSYTPAYAVLTRDHIRAHIHFLAHAAPTRVFIRAYTCTSVHAAFTFVISLYFFDPTLRPVARRVAALAILALSLLFPGSHEVLCRHIRFALL